ncbi:hypothetical protein [Bacillus pumilus]|uniref:hypothetical protein n=1 Tax=Bacillus pumilus TaxID=1408 RepID=UPI0011A84698|nr:hypothetical protein [Bacillus pumilus]
MGEYEKRKCKGWLRRLSTDCEKERCGVEMISGVEKEEMEGRGVWKRVEQEALFGDCVFYWGGKGRWVLE